jgi:hypothetical protein
VRVMDLIDLVTAVRAVPRRTVLKAEVHRTAVRAVRVMDLIDEVDGHTHI